MRAIIIALAGAIGLGWFAPAAQALSWQDRILGQVPAPDERQRAAAQYRHRKAKPKKAKIKKASYAATRRATGRPVRIPVRRYYTNAKRGSVLRGLASYYWQPQRVAAGGWYDPNALTAAHRALPFGTRVRVTNLRNGRSVIVRINDRGPYIRGRIIDLSRRAATVIRMRKAGVVPVRVEVL